MKQLNEQRVNKTISIFAMIVTILSLGHFVALQFSIQLAQDIDDLQKQHKRDTFNYEQNIPFAIVLGVFAVMQFVSALLIFILNIQSHTTKAIYYCSLIGMLVSFSIGVQMTILSQQYNTMTRQWPKNIDYLPKLMPFYWTVQIDATTSFLFMFPMMAFVFYHKLDKYLQLQKQQSKQNSPLLQTSSKGIGYLWIFLFNTLAQIALVFNLYQMSDIQDKINYALDNIIDQYAYYIEVGIVISFVGIVMQMRNTRSSFLSKRQVVMLAVIIGLFQIGSLILLAIKTSQIFIRLNLIQNDQDLFPDREEADIFKWQLLGYSIINFISVLLQIPYLKLVSTSSQKQELRNTLITEQSVLQTQQNH